MLQWQANQKGICCTLHKYFSPSACVTRNLTQVFAESRLLEATKRSGTVGLVVCVDEASTSLKAFADQHSLTSKKQVQTTVTRIRHTLNQNKLPIVKVRPEQNISLEISFSWHQISHQKEVQKAKIKGQVSATHTSHINNHHTVSLCSPRQEAPKLLKSMKGTLY